MTCYGQEDLMKELKAEGIIKDIVNLIVIYQENRDECLDRISEVLIVNKYMREVKRYERC